MDYKKYTDKYFLRAKTILEKENLNPFVTMQCFTRIGPGKIKGINKAINFIESNSDIIKQRGSIFSLLENDTYDTNETIMLIKAPLQSIIELETIYLGILSKETTIYNDSLIPLSLEKIQLNTTRISNLVNGRPLFYFGARHWSYEDDAAISEAAFNGGATECSTDNGAKQFGHEGIGTIPHALVIAFASKYRIEDATLQSILAFDKHMDKKIHRIALVDTFNREITDSWIVADVLKDRLYGIRIDTCGENYGEGSDKTKDGIYDYGRGVTIELAKNVRNALNENGHENVKIILSSGFANYDKVKAFVKAEETLNMRLFDGLGIGQLYHSRSFTADIVEVDGKLLSKTGRNYKPNARLVRML